MTMTGCLIALCHQAYARMNLCNAVGGITHEKEKRRMTQNGAQRGVFIAMLVGMFVVGFFLGSVSQRNADAQLQDIGKGALEKATQSGGALGSVAELGSSIVEMQEHVNGLQKNLDTLKKVQGALGAK
jgi:hypothetical protein